MAFNFNSAELRGFFILLYKGFLLRKRHYIVTAFEIILPVLAASIPAILVSELNIHSSREGGSFWVNETTYDPFSAFKVTGDDADPWISLAYSPTTPFAKKVVEAAIETWMSENLGSKEAFINVQGFDDSEKVELYLERENRESTLNVTIGVVFNSFNTGSKSPSSLDYTLRLSKMSRTTYVGKYRFKNDFLGISDYSDNQFLSWQAAIDKAFIQLKAAEQGKALNYEISMQRFPVPGHQEYIGTGITTSIPTILVYCFFIFVINLLRRVTEEKANGSKELMKMMGMTNYSYWTSTFLNYFIVGGVIMLIITIIYKSPLKNSVVLLEHSNFFILLFVFLLFMASLVLFCLAVTTFFKKAVFGIIFLLIAYVNGGSLLSSLVFSAMDGTPSTKYLYLSPIAKTGLCLFPPGALYAAFQYIDVYEVSGEGINWKNLNSYEVIPDFSLSDVMWSQLLSIFLFWIIIWYVDAVWPWQYGVPKPFNFPFTKSYWCGYDDNASDDILLGADSEPKSGDYFEMDPTGIPPGVVINNLSKVFRTGFQTKVAVKDVSLNIYNGQITALLGHNGAGKTTTINILTGLYMPSGGSASINGWDIFRQTAKARQSLGVCPQHNVLFDTLTVEEHLKLYAALKGVSWSQLDNETDVVLKLLFLMDKKQELSKNLSGGMKRKLSLAIAIVGGSEVLFLDEPTSGMDVQARRSVWDALLKIREQRTVILTTHYMEEADVLGDRIAIMADGEIQCCGSPLFLKKKFGTGYHLHVVKNNDFNLEGVLTVLNAYLPEASVENDYEREATFCLVSNSNSSFGELFEEIEGKKEFLGINSCGITVTTMEDVFLNVANMLDLKLKNQNNLDAEIDDVSEMKDIYVQNVYETKIINFSYYLNQFVGLLMKRVHYSKRHWSISINQLFMPFLLMCMLLFIINSKSGSGSFLNPKSVKLSLTDVYGKTDGFYSSNGHFSSLPALYKNVLEEHDVSVHEVPDPKKFILDYAENMNKYIKTFVLGGAFKAGNELNLTAWFNGFPVHSMPMSLALMDAALLKSVDPSADLSVNNHPLPGISYLKEDPEHSMESILASLFVPLAFAFVSPCFLLVPIHERATKSKLLQLMTGIPAAFYWLTMFVYDFFVSILLSIILCLPFAAFAHDAFFGSHLGAIGTALLIMILYGWASIPFCYLFTLIFQKPDTGFSIVQSVCVLFGTAIGSSLTSLAPYSENNYLIFFDWLFKIVPSYSLSSSFGKLFSVSYANAFCGSLSLKELEFNCDPKHAKPTSSMFKCCKDVCGDKCYIQVYPITFEKKGCAAELLFLFGMGFAYFLLLLLFESPIMSSLGRFISQYYNRLRRLIIKVQDVQEGIQDSDVLQEEERVRSNYQQLIAEEALVVSNLSKQFKGLKAVDSLTFGIHKTECFGLLGVNGAGKTTTFRMLTGDCYPDEGNAVTNTVSVITDLKRFQSHLGYCPQFDALIDRLSARELITLFARLRGILGPKLDRTVNTLIKMTDLTQHADKPSMVYSGGNKRKLSIALALIGAPPLLLLDEPTAGVDPVSRRKIWKILSLAQMHSGAAVILTTHSMEESEALCSRLAIMVNGRFRCLGSIQELKSKFGQGYTLIIKMKKEEEAVPSAINAIKTYIDTNLTGAQLKDDHQGMLQYHVVNPDITLSHLFKFMAEMKEKFNLEDYVISDTSLEQIFLSFARSQRVVAT